MLNTSNYSKFIVHDKQVARITKNNKEMAKVDAKLLKFQLYMMTDVNKD